MTTRDYPADGLVVHWDSDVCRHSGVCARSLPTVFRPRSTPWVDTTGADPERLAAVIDTCPSRALTYTRTATSDDASQEAAVPDTQQTPAVTITVSENGPYEVQGPVTIVGADGAVIRETERVYLCRCGQSKKKPYCDSSHRAAGFTDPGTGPAPGRE